jgi:hypothetical protein
MTSPCPRLQWWCLAVFVLGLQTQARAQWTASLEEPQWLRLRLAKTDTQLAIEGQWEQQTTSGEKTEHDYLYIEPTIGLETQGSIYHPNFLNFSFATQLGLSYQEVTQDPPGGSQDSTHFLDRYGLNMYLLQQKPFATHFLAEHGITYTDFDFFTRARVESLRYGGNSGYTAGPVPFTVSVLRMNEDVTATQNDTTLDDTTVTLNANNDRSKIGHTDASYRYYDFRQSQENSPKVSGTTQTANLFDSETFGRGEWIRMNSTALYNDTDETEFSTRGVLLTENVALQHEPNLSSTYSYTYQQQDSGPTDTDSHQASALVHHQLYQSLSTSLGVHGSSQHTTSSGSTYDSTIYGVSLDENYSKHLSTWGQLNIGQSLRLDQEQQDSSGQLIYIVNEPHTLTDGVITLLDQPYVVSVSLVTNPDGVPYTEGQDYIITPQGARTQISRVVGGRIPNGGAVLVNYSVTPPPSGDFTTFSSGTQIRLEVLDHQLAVYARLNIVENYGGQGLVLQNITEIVTGAEFTKNWIHLGAEYEDYDSNLSPFRSVRVFESFQFTPMDNSTLGFDFTQTMANFADSDREQTYTFIARSQVRLTSHLIYGAEGGIFIQRGRQMDQDRSTARTTLDFVRGQLTVSLGYSFQDQDYLGDVWKTHNFFLHVKRVF